MSDLYSLFSGLPGRYAHSLFGVASAEGFLEKITEDIALLETLLSESVDFRCFVTSPIYSMKDRKSVVDDLIKKAHFCTTMGNFLQLLVVNGRMSILSSIITSFHRVCSYYRGEVLARVKTSSGSLSLDQQDQLKDFLGKMLRKRVLLDIVENSSLMGGFVVEMGSTQIDASLRAKFSRLALILKEVN
ncbi:ATP synthase F1 subunit delta [Candidatus Liberibacter sp.]|uniref:ATP synthase F1 subunit delta n=1 Tax=Candidatus Liberibacter sp. TaxID=34022 RepID=UPI0015F4869A|nr:ATP synthase F1 subunit delta [Candidatus Liberibacter sp.]MBA5723686.1 ATP synthase F1 subunit delta [Candidatus Liberibacter sp.]